MTPVVAVVPFGAVAERAGDEEAGRPGRWARQIARRLVDRFAEDPALEVRPVFLVVPQTESEAGYLVFGSTPDAGLAAQYAEGVGGTHALTGTYREAGASRRLEADLVDAASRQRIASFERDLGAGELHLVEPALAGWLAGSLGVTPGGDLATPAVANEDAYGALLEGMDAEVDATLLAQGDPSGAERAVLTAATRYLAAVRADPAAEVAEQRLLVIAAGAVEREDHRMLVPILGELARQRPRSWRAHYLLGELRRLSGDASGATVALEHADALRPLAPADALRLAQLHIASGAPAVATSKLRWIVRGDAEPAVKGTARRLLLGLRHPELERDLEEAGRIAVDGELSRADDAEARFARVLAEDGDIWEAHFGRGLLAWQRGDDDAADAAFGRAVALNPAAADLLRDLGEPG